MKNTFNIFGGLLVAFILFAALPAAYALADGPTITGATNITAEATSSAGAYVTFNVTAADASSTSITVFCAPPSGDLFALSTTTVTCTANDGTATTTETFSVAVVDTTPPSVTAPADQSFTTTGTSTTPTLVSATSTDLVDPNPAISYSPTSFSVGTTTVTWTATDASENIATTTSNVFIASAVPSVLIHLEIETATTTLFNGNVSVSGCATPNNATSTTNGFCAFSAAGITVDATWFSFGAMVNSIGGVAGDSNNFWLWFLNGDIAQTGIDSYQLLSGDHILWTIGREPLKISASSTSPVVGATTTVNVLGFDTNAFDFKPVSGAAINGVSASTTDANGNVDIVATSTNPFTISASANGFLPSQSITITPRAPQATLAIRDGSTLVGPFTVTLPDVSAPPVLIAPTAATTTYAVPARSVLALLTSIDFATSSFDITDLQYFSSLNSFLVNCISIPSKSSSPDCYDWTYSVNGVFPQIGMDGYTLRNSDTVYIFFGKAWQISTDKTAVVTGESFTATAKSYDASTGTYVPASSTIVGAVQLDADGNVVYDSNWNPVEVATSTTDSNGQASLLLDTVGVYGIGIKDSGYYPTVSITISAPQPVVSVNVGGGGGGGISVTHHTIDIDKAIQFLSAHQKPDGSFGAGLYTDWAAIALASGPNNSNKDKITAYLKSSPNIGTSVTDYERRAMALMSLSINPYTGTDTDYIKKIADRFDGTQIGDASLVNDDIFAIFPLMKSGHVENDPMMQKIITFIISKQRADGSWEGSVDMTAAAIQSLSLFPSAQSVSQARIKARDYLLKNQQSNGGFGGGSFSASWVLQAIAALSEPASLWIKNNSDPNDYLFSLQQNDGGIEPVTADESTRVWATAYAIPAALGKTWTAILSSFPRPAVSANAVAQTSASSAAGTPSVLSIDNETTSTASTTPVVASATTTLAVKSASAVVNVSSTTSAGFSNSLPGVAIRDSGRKSEITAMSVGPINQIAQSEVTTKNDAPATPNRRQATALAAAGTSGVAETLRHIGSVITGTVSFFIDMFLSAFRLW
ncbi:MAG: hypothetical protein A3B13_01710 [Candidatus Liptonbacteria bacterium RIFCSPLOWO2_01_FULL_45_15]|uniref:Transcobalamin-like C-terminal domain-containing protein n=1 Tax=Candidatus Liptonbacteria bacterium RIFCSPLOWO2_01_FULL_45_15 TaxID=1798649 RepID=A0A1G2CFM3_9BACT|nr:MAG: hypothetical protein A3B13_01710 [Candidatus Liptonbacteria bacterium RIFCSPLOWO2_01_FULL_45_15]